MAEFELRFRGRVVEGAVGDGSWTITDPTSGDVIPWRVLLVAPDLGDLPVVLAEPADVTSLADEVNPGHRVAIPKRLRRTLEEAFEPGPAGGARAERQESDQALVGAHRRLWEKYQKLGEDEGLDLNSGDSFLRARELGLFDSLMLVDLVQQKRPGQILVYSYLPDVQQAAADPNWVASACYWAGLSTLYDTTSPMSPNSPPGKSLVLWGSGNLPYLPFVVRAAETS